MRKLLIQLATKLCMGVKRCKFHPKTGKIYWEIEHDTATLRFLLEWFLQLAKVNVNLNSPDEHYAKIQKEIQEAKRFLNATTVEEADTKIVKPEDDDPTVH